MRTNTPSKNFSGMLRRADCVTILLFYFAALARCRRGQGHAFELSVCSSNRQPWQVRVGVGRPCSSTGRLQQQVQKDNERGTQESKDEPHSSFHGTAVCVLTNNEAFADEFHSKVAAELATRLHLPVCSMSTTSQPHLSSDFDSLAQYTHALVVLPYQFEDLVSYAVAIRELSPTTHSRKSPRRKMKRPSKQQQRSKPFFVDFCPPTNSRLGKRFQGESGSDLLLKAVSPGKDCKTVYDLTAGFGQDSILMAQGGALQVVMVERDPLVATLLSDALRRLRLIASSELEHRMRMPTLTRRRALDLANRLSNNVTVGDAVHVARHMLNDPSVTPAQRPDICYVDPMFPSRKKSAAVKKNMQLLHGLLGSRQPSDDSDNDDAARNELALLEAALSLARERVVVKRPIHATRLGEGSELGMTIKPSYQIKGSINRWDVYVIQRNETTMS